MTRSVAARITAALALAVVVLPMGSGVAAAHAGGLAPEPSLPRVVAVEPAVPGLAVGVIEAGARLRLDNGTGATVTVLPAPGASRTVEPVVEPGGIGRWVDPQVTAAGRTGPGPTAWTVALAVGPQQVSVRGETVWPAPPAAGAWWAATGLLAVVTVAIGVLALRRRAAMVAAGLLTLVAAASYVVHVLGSALAPDVGDYWPTVLATAGAVGIGALVAALGGAVLALAGKRFGLLLCALAGALLVLLTGADTTSFANAVLPFGWSPTLDRVTTVLTAGAGLGLFLTGFAVLRALTPETRPESLQEQP